jgi:4-hydroxyacetophenone monooxygenase
MTSLYENHHPQADTSDSDYQRMLDEALAEADVRLLLMVVHQLSGDGRWLAAPYLPARDVRLVADPNAGLDLAVQNEIRTAAYDLLIRPVEPVIPVPDEARLLKMMSVCLGEQVAPEYVPMMMQEMGFAPDPMPTLTPVGDKSLHPTFTIVGAGVSGILIGMKLKQAGASFRILEQNTAIGGTWHENTYPDCGVDTPNHFYSYSFARNNEWSHYFSLRGEIHDYLQRCVDQYGLSEHIDFGITVEEAHWNESTQEWAIETQDIQGEKTRHTTDILISAVGQLNRPSIPNIPGLADFSGPSFHSAQWRHDISLAGKRVGVIGAGASAMQFVPLIAPEAESLTIFQRSHQWARSIDEYRKTVSPSVKWLLNNVPFYGAWMRFTLAWRYGDGLLRFLKRDPTWPHTDRSVNRGNDRHRAELADYISEQLRDRPDLFEKVLPTFPPYAKRMLIDNGWYRTLTRSNVDLVMEPIARVVSDGIVTADGQIHNLDALILATGFLATDILGHIDITGRNGVRLATRWKDNDARAYLGMSVPGFPNFFVMYGPNTNLGHGGSIIFQAECQGRYLMDLFDKMKESGATSVEVRSDVHDSYNDRVDAEHAKMIWTHPGVAPWYRNAAGRVVSNSPWRLVDYWQMTRHADLSEFVVMPHSVARESA